MAPAPEVAVVVGDFGRRRFLPFALRSVESQRLPRPRFEVVVTKNYRDEALDRALERSGATVLFDPEPRIGRWLRRAVDASRAPIVTFLDDDDEYEPDRLERVLSVFGEHPGLGFYRNRVSVLDAEGQSVPPARWRSLEADAAFDTLGPIYVGPEEPERLLDLAAHRTYVTFNSSTMALRRDLLDGDVGESFERTELPDQALFLAALLSRRGVFLDDRRLTRYRYYPGNVTREVGWLARAEASYADLATLAARHDRPRVAAWLSERSVHYGRMFRGRRLVDRVTGRAARAEVARQTAEYLRYLARHPAERRFTLDTWAAGAYGLAYVPLGPLVAELARARLTAAPGA